MRAARHVLASLAAALTLGCNGNATGEPAPEAEGQVPVRLQAVATGLDFPLLVTSPPGDTRRLFVVEKGGRIRVVEDGRLLAVPFLDLSSEVSKGGEQGLLGLAFHPRYGSTGRFFVNYTDGAGDTRVVRFQVSSDPNVADPASATLVLAVDQPYPNHNGGHIAFGPDRFLYVGLGDGGSGNDPQGHGQNVGTLLGALLRIDVDRTGQGRAYTIPPDNPFVGRAGARPEIWSYGLRNPWRFSFDRETGDLYIGDVGQNAREEVDVSVGPQAGRGLNYGWAIMEGTLCRDAAGCQGRGFTLPVLEYGTRDRGNCSVTGGYVYRGAVIPDLRGTYFYADYCAGWVRSFRYADGRVTDRLDWRTLAPGGQIPSFGEDAAGELYVVTTDAVYHIAPRYLGGR